MAGVETERLPGGTSLLSIASGDLVNRLYPSVGYQLVVQRKQFLPFELHMSRRSQRSIGSPATTIPIPRIYWKLKTFHMKPLRKTQPGTTTTQSITPYWPWGQYTCRHVCAANIIRHGYLKDVTVLLDIRVLVNGSSGRATESQNTATTVRELSLGNLKGLIFKRTRDGYSLVPLFHNTQHSFIEGHNEAL